MTVDPSGTPTSLGDAKTRGLNAPQVVRFEALEPRWTTSRSTEPGYFRWLVSYVGGPPGHINSSPESGVVSEELVVGVMGLPAGNRQDGFHTHTVTEIYVVLRGALRSFGPGVDHVARHLDCIVIPPGVPHGVEALGAEDTLFLWIHDNVELKGSSTYYDTLEDAPPVEEPITLVPWPPRIERSEESHGGLLREYRRWLDVPVILECVTIPAANAEPPRVTDSLEVDVVVKGRMHLRGSPFAPLEPLDAVVVPAGVAHALAAGALETTQVVVARRPAPMPA